MTKNELLICIIKDLSKRKGTINDLISVIKNIHNISYFYYTSKKEKRKNPNVDIKNKYAVLLNSSIVILYSHWEGFVKFSSDEYVKFIQAQKFDRDRLLSSGNKCFVDYFINKKGNNLSDVLQIILDKSSIPIENDMLRDIQNLNFSNFKELLTRIGLNFSDFLDQLKIHIENSSGLIEGPDFKTRLTYYKESKRFLSEYIENDNNSLLPDKTLQNIINVNKNHELKCQNIGLVALRHKIAHGHEVKIDFRRFEVLSEITLLLLDVYLEFFKNELNKKYVDN